MQCSQGARFRKLGETLSGLLRKNPHSQGVQEAEFALVGIGIALLRFHAQKAAFALNRSGDYAVAGREIAFISERAECTTPSSEGKTLSNKTPGSSRSDNCSALRESVSESGERSFQDCAEKTPTRR